MTNKLSERQLARLKELYNKFLDDQRGAGHLEPDLKNSGWTYSHDLRTDLSLFKRGLVTYRGVPGDIWHPAEFRILKAGYEAQKG